MEKNTKGITLIALIITIIVLLILAGTAVTIAINGGDIFGKASEARESWNTAVDKEESTLLDLLDILDDVNRPIPDDAVARINENYYNTLQLAIDAVIDDNTQTRIILLKDIQENVVVPVNKNIVLNLNSHTITNDSDNPIITISGRLSIKNGTIIGQFNSKVETILVNENSEINLSNTMVDRNSESENSWETIGVYGLLNIDSGKVRSSNSNAICLNSSGSHVNISGTAEIEVPDGTYAAVCNHGTTTIAGGRITAKDGWAIENKGTLIITGGKIFSKNVNAIANSTDCPINISGTADIESSAPDRTTISNKGFLTIAGGKITARNYVAITTNRKITMTGGKITSRKNCINNLTGGVLEIGGTAELEGLSPDDYPTLANDGMATIRGGKIISTQTTGIYNDAIWNQSNGTIYLIDGIAECRSQACAIYNEGTAYKTNRFQFIGSAYGTITSYTE